MALNLTAQTQKQIVETACREACLSGSTAQDVTRVVTDRFPVLEPTSTEYYRYEWEKATGVVLKRSEDRASHQLTPDQQKRRQAVFDGERAIVAAVVAKTPLVRSKSALYAIKAKIAALCGELTPGLMPNRGSLVRAV